MSAVRDWLEAIGLGQYADAFETNDIDTDLLSRRDDQLLKELGVASAGHRLRLRDAIAKLAPTPIAEPNAASAATAAEAPATSPERRQLTVMFCDLVGSTALSTRLDPEDLREVIGRYHTCVAEMVSRFDGFVAKYMGDGVLAVLSRQLLLRLCLSYLIDSGHPTGGIAAKTIGRSGAGWT
jgi:hypothetical protein